MHTVHCAVHHPNKSDRLHLLSFSFLHCKSYAHKHLTCINLPRLVVRADLLAQTQALLDLLPVHFISLA